VQAGAALVAAADPGRAAALAVDQAGSQLGAEPEFGVLFASEHFLGAASELVAAVSGQAGRVPMIGCVAAGVIGSGREVEDEPAVSLWLAAGCGPAETFGMEFIRTASGGAYGGYRFGPDAHLMIADPLTFPADGLLAHLNEHVPGATVIGGLASGGVAARRTRLFLDGRVLDRGAVGVALPAADVRPLVAQGCRPVGDPYIVTRADGRLILELAGRPPLARLRELAAALPGPDQELLGAGAHVGIVMNEYQAELRQGDFLIRGIVGADPDSGAIAVGDEVEVGQTVQFHVRDAGSAREDLRRVLEREAWGLAHEASGALLFSCTGRGRQMFGEPDHDAGQVATMLGFPPVAGLFCAGELGPVAGRNYLHTFTASIAMFP
jgi:small ligand-binding sensory domain FIST